MLQEHTWYLNVLVLLLSNIQNLRLNLLEILWEPRGKPDTSFAQHDQEKVEFSMRYWSLSKKYEHHFDKF